DKKAEKAWEFLGYAVDRYHSICRAFRNKWNWSPDIVDKILLKRVEKIFSELLEDVEREKDGYESSSIKK
ncbi:hypothetical protein, partial [Leptospira idonii]|uniref:hypothetical protein n=1 Tax=Leptospira idonii TaxID=1193500 RepID=UPI001AF00CC6